MNTTSSTAGFSAPWPDLSTMLRSWTEAKLPLDEPTHAIAREAVQAGMQLIEQCAADTVSWLSVASGHVSELSRLAQTCAGKAAAAEDAAALWGAEVEWLSESARLGNASAQSIWAALIDNQSRLAQELMAQGNQNVHRFLGLFNGLGNQAGVRIDPASETPVISGDAFAPFVDWMAQATQAAGAATQALLRAASHEAPRAEARASEPAKMPAHVAPIRRSHVARHAA